MAKNSADLEGVVVYQDVIIRMAPDSNLTLNKSFIKIGSEDGPIIECSVLMSINLPSTDKEKDMERIDVVRGSACAMKCLHSVDLTKLSNGGGYLCACSRHLVHVNSVPVGVCQILELPNGVSIGH